jgi:iron complex outermembrane recepter protein
MTLNPRVYSAVVAILGAHAAVAFGQAQPADQTGGTPSAQQTGLPEVIVTAQHRAQDIQDVPITIQALTSDTLDQLNVQTFDEFIKYLPNVSQTTYGPAQGNIFMRGLASNQSGSIGQGAGTTGVFPAVATYLDEQSGQMPGRNLDIYAVDLERIEVLEGPQGTLFGGGALSGVLRYVTNKPKLNTTEASVTADYGVTAHGDPNTSLNAVLNLPLVEDHLAMRGVVYEDRQGGYINNVPGTFTRAGTDEGFTRYNGGVAPTNSVSINNNNLVGNAINPLTYQGIRVELLYKINDSWDALLSQSYQNMDAQGVFYQMPDSSEDVTFNKLGEPIGGQPLPPLSVTLFNPSYDKDRFENTSLVVNGMIGDLKLVYAGAYLVRNVDQVQDYTNYARGVFGYYYQCANYSTNPASGQCYTPNAIWREHETNTHQSHELRLSTPDSWRVRALAGVYWEKYDMLDQTQWTYVTVPTCSPALAEGCFLPIQPWPGSPAFTPLPDTGFFDDTERGYKQLAEFASVDFDIIPKVLTITGGIRHFRYDENETGGDVGSTNCKAFSTTTYFGFCGQNPVAGAFGSTPPYGTDFAANPYETSSSGSRGLASLSWHVTADAMLYYTYSQGFRPGSFNRSTACHLPGPDGVPQYCTPASTVPDTVTNNEVGLKSQWLEQRLQFNATFYQEYWDNAQVSFFDPQSGLGNLTFNTNGPSYRVRGFEPFVQARVTRGLTVQAAASWKTAEQTNSPFLIDNNPASVNYGKAITSIPNVYGAAGSPTTYSPPFNMNARVRYDWLVGDYSLFVQAGGVHTAHMLTETGNVPAYNIPGYTTYDAAAGIGKGAWDVQFYGQNITDVNTPTDISSDQFVVTEVPLRPRVLGIRFDYRFSEAK